MGKELGRLLNACVLVVVTASIALAVNSPHVGMLDCTGCHYDLYNLEQTATGLDNLCVRCHNPAVMATGFGPRALANPFGSTVMGGYTSALLQTSHNWAAANRVPAAGAAAVSPSSPLYNIASTAPRYGIVTGATLAETGLINCASCHDQHGNSRTNPKLLRLTTAGDRLCFECHGARNRQSQLDGTHPVNVAYSSAVERQPQKYHAPPLNANPANPLSDLGARLAADGKLLCSTCHGVHYADSRSANYVNGFKNISSGDGNLLRTDPRGRKVAAGEPDALNICTNCHAGKANHNGAGQDIQCLDCHAAHVDFDPQDPTGAEGTNVYLIRRNLPGNASRIFFRYTGCRREYVNDEGTGVCQACHTPPPSIPDHASSDPRVCNNCHSHTNANGSFTAAMPSHDADLGADDVIVFSNDTVDHGAGFSMTENCTLCHDANLVRQHKSNCSLCHGGANPPAAPLIGQWNKGCAQASCHPAIHAAMGANHNGIYWDSSASCDLCHDGVGGFPGSGDNCSRCHEPGYTAAAVGDHQPPTTTADARTEVPYVGPTVIHLAATDAGAGVSVTFFYNEYHHRFEIGNDVYYSAPTTGAKSHTLQFYSIDHAMNVEPVKSVTFAIQAAADTTPPTTTCSAVAGKVYSGSQLFTLTATDIGWGVASTWYRLDSGSFATGTTVPVASPASGSASHTIEWYSLDKANNREATRSVTFTVAAVPAPDTIPPATIASFAPAANALVNANQTVTLVAADNAGGSGVKATFYKVDAGAFVAGTSFTIAGEGLHSFSYYSVDNAGNSEALHTANTFRIDTIPPLTICTVAAGAAYTGPQTFTLAATDGSGSGVASTLYKLDDGPWTVGSAIAVSPPAAGSAAHTVQWYAIDNAGNREAVQSASFVIVTPAIVSGTTTISFRTNASFGGWAYVTWEVHDANGTIVKDVNGNDCSWWNDDPAHPSSMWKDYVVPAGVAYTLYGAWGPMPDGPDSDTGLRTVTPGEAAPGATITWWWY
ncbi:cytochrome c [Geotalea uraniireducens]|uniref:Cytochrome c n=1 Tax=Geotalea uraniireducens TaxID=351604 RepID=A0ABN6VRA2_9BACT|nr:cytochrome c3 family protein [Geotalea uraniireducens]BDV42888.1 cytochrome c [Geotalea uraniireducens]